MKKISYILVLLMIFAFALTGCGGSQADEAAAPAGPTDEAVEISVSAAASLTEALNDIKAEYAKESNAVIQLNFGGSGALQKQIEEGAPCDLFISANTSIMDTLQDEGLIVDDSRKDMLGNTLTLIASAEKADAIQSYQDLTSDQIESVAIGTPETAPAGKYAKQSMETLGIWDQTENKVVYAKDVKQVLEYVDTGNADCGFVYRSDAMGLETGAIIMDMPQDSHDSIVYPAALMKDSPQGEAASKFFVFLQSDTAKGIFEKYGFSVL